jgi:hypothetical protein
MLVRVREAWPQVTEHAALTVVLALSDHGHLAVVCRTRAIADELNAASDRIVDELAAELGARPVSRIQAFAVSSELESVLVIALGDALDQVEDLRRQLAVLTDSA